MLEEEVSTERIANQDREQVKASSVDAEGIVMKMHDLDIQNHDGDEDKGYGDYYSIEFMLQQDGEFVPAFMNFSSKRLYDLLVIHESEITDGKPFRLRSNGRDDYDRHYYLSPV